MFMLSMFIIFMMTTSLSPLKMSLILTFFSICSSFMIYKTLNSMFIPMVCMISFSSGMMILFSYCSIMSNQETMKNKIQKMKILTTSTLFLTLVIPSKNTETLKKMILESEKTQTLTIIMIIIIIVMISINKTFFNPTKKLMQSY